MSKAKRPWMKWYPADWRADPGLRMCSFAARGLWADVLALMHEAEPYGYLLVNGRQPTPQQLAGLLGGSAREIERLLHELAEAGVYSEGGDGTLYSRRMVRDADRDKRNSDYSRAVGQLGGNPEIRRGTVPKAQRMRPFKRSDAPLKTRRIFERDGGECHWCRAKIEFDTFHVDHVQAICDGGTNDEANLVAACPACNHRRAREEAAAPTVGGVRQQPAKTSDNNGVGSPTLSHHKPEARSQKPEGEVAQQQATPPAPDPANDAALRLIAAFDAAQEAVFAEQRRPWPAQTDLSAARRMLAAGFAEADAKPLFEGLLQRMKGSGKAAPKALAYVEGAVGEHLAALKAPLPVPDAPMPTLPAFLDRRQPAAVLDPDRLGRLADVAERNRLKALEEKAHG